MAKIEEIWKDVNGYEGHYRVSNIGRISSIQRIIKCKRHGAEALQLQGARILKQKEGKRGYFSVSLWRDAVGVTFLVHRLVAAAFLLSDSKRKNINHIDGNKLNNHYENLEWSTQLENVRHAMKSGLLICKGEHNSQAKLDNFSVLVIRTVHKNDGVSIASMARYFRVSASTVSLIVNRKRWAHI